MEIMPLGPAENAAFNEILAELRELLSSIDQFRETPTKPEWLKVSGKPGCFELLKKSNGTVWTKPMGGNEEWSRAHARHSREHSDSGGGPQDNLIVKQIHDSSSGNHLKLLKVKSGANGINYNNSADTELLAATLCDTGKGHGTIGTAKPSTTSQQFVKDMDYLANDAGNMTVGDNRPPYKSNVVFSRDIDSAPYLHGSIMNELLLSCSNSNMNGISRTGVDNHLSEERSVRKGKEVENLPISQVWIRMPRTAPEFDITEANSSTPESHLKSRGRPGESAHLYRAIPYQSRPLSWKQALSKKFKKAKLKTVQTLPKQNRPVDKEQDHPGEQASNARDRETELIAASEFSVRSSVLPGEKEGMVSYSQRRASSLDDGQGQEDLGSEDQEHLFDPYSLLCYKKKKGYRNSFQYMKSSHSEGNERPEYGLMFSSSSESRNSPTSDSVTEIHNRAASRESVDKSPLEKGQASAKDFANESAPPERRSTVGSSYLREAGKSSPNTCPTNGTSDSATLKSFSQNQYRHSLHVFKGHNVLSQAENENRWSTDDRLPKGTSFIAQPPTQDLDKGFKASIIKPKSLFHKATKSTSKAAAMSSSSSSVDRNKLTERSWNSTEACGWSSMSGQRVELTEVDLLSLSECECTALQKIAEHRLREIDLGASISVPKDESKLNRGKHNSSWRGVHLPLVAKNKSKKEPYGVFGIPLFRAVENDQLLRLQTVKQDGACGVNDDDAFGHSSSEASPKPQRRNSSSQDGSAEHSSASVFSNTDGNDYPSTPPNDSPINRRRKPGGSALKRRPAQFAAIDRDETELLQSLVTTGSGSKKNKQSLLSPTMPQVPYVVQKCCAHILKHGLDVTGIFRIAGAKTRVKQLREEFDHGVDVTIDENYHAHDVAALLKEFFRDLPEALLTRELYRAFISTAKLSGPQRLSALRCLIWLLPMPNRDTLQELLSFLATVAEHSGDRIDTNGKQICGNKMTVANLSMIFGPNILHRDKKTSQSSSEAQYQVQSIERAEESKFVIGIVDDMIRIQKELFLIPRETHSEIICTLQESDPDAVDFLLRRKEIITNGGCKTPNSVDGEDSPPLDCKPKRLPSTEHNGNQEKNHSDVNNNKNNSALLKSSLVKNNEVQRTPAINITANKSAISEERRRKISLESDERAEQDSISFTDEDLEDILHADVNFARPERTIIPTPPDNLSQEKTVNGNADSLVTRLSPKPRPRVIKLVPEPVPLISRRQAFSLDSRRENMQREQRQPDENRRSPIPNYGKQTHLATNSPRQAHKDSTRPRIFVSESSTSGFVDMSSSSSEYSSSIGTYFDDTNTVETSYHRRRFEAPDQKVRRDVDIARDTPSSDEKGVLKRIPSALHLRHVHRTHGKRNDSVVPLHSLRISKQVQGRKPEKNPENSRTPTYGCSERRVSKDDMYLTRSVANL